MSTWTWTAGLTGLALTGALVAPSISRPTATGTPPTTPPAPTATDGTVTLRVETDRAMVVRGTSEERFVTVTLTPGEATGEVSRRPVDVAVVMDTSGSMQGEGKIEHARAAATHLANAMQDDDLFSLVQFSNGASVVVSPTSGRASHRTTAAISRLSPGGGTNLYAGLQLGLEQAQSQRGSRVGRLVLLSDGLANEGVTDPTAMRRLAATAQAHGVTVSTVGLGVDYNEDLMAALSDAGGGQYAFVDDAGDLERVFAKELDRAASVVARRAVVDLTFGDAVEPLDLLGWEGASLDDGWSVPVGDLYSGEPIKLVARVRVRAGAQTTVDVATASVRFDDLEGETRAVAPHTAQVEVTEVVAEAEASIQADAAQASTRAWANRFLDLSSRAFARGDKDEAKALAREGQQAYEALQALGYVDAEMAGELDDMRLQEAAYDEAAPASAEGKALIKGAKEKARARAR